MAEAANPQGGANQEPPSVEQRMANFLDQYAEEQTAPPQDSEQPAAPANEAQEQPQGQAQDELTPEDLPAEEVEAQPSPVDEFEIVHNGQQRKLSREETIRLAQQGFDYSQKMHAVGEQERAVVRRLEQVQQLEQLSQMMAPELAQVKAVESQLAQWQNVNWVQLATENPLEYPKYRAQYDQLLHAYQATQGQFQQKAQAFQRQREQVMAQTLEAQRAKLLDMIPAWKDQAKYEQGAREVRDYLIREGVDPQAVERLSDASSVAIAWKAAQYDKLSRSKREKSGQLKTVPPVTRPGARQPASQANADKQQALMQKLRKSGDMRDAQALLLERLK